MVTGHVFIATSLDGFIARPDGTIDWLEHQDTGAEDHGYDAFMASVDGLVMGRGTFETVRQFDPWPYAKPVIVLSQTMSEADLPDRLDGHVEISRETPVDLMERLSTTRWSRAYVDGGQVIQSFLREGLIETLTLTRIPILIGSGRPLFGTLPQDVQLEHLETKSFPSGFVSSTYRVQNPITP